MDIPRFFDNFDLITQLFSGYSGLSKLVALVPDIFSYNDLGEINGIKSRLQELGSSLWIGRANLLSHDDSESENPILQEALHAMERLQVSVNEVLTYLHEEELAAGDFAAALTFVSAFIYQVVRREQLGVANRALGERTESEELIDSGEAEIENSKKLLGLCIPVLKDLREHKLDVRYVIDLTIDTKVSLQLHALELKILTAKILQQDAIQAVDLDGEKFKPWEDQLFDPVAAAMWLAIGLKPASALQWIKAGFNDPNTVFPWVARGLGPTDVQEFFTE
jgi:hypothetical protein